MKKLLLLATLVASTSSFADVSDCSDPSNQQEMNRCSLIKANKALDALLKKMVSTCLEQEEVKTSEGGSMHPLLFNSCVRDLAVDLAKKL